jgi:hypothetical protein
MLIHSVCFGELFNRGEYTYCDICSREVAREEIIVVDDSPSPYTR